MMRVFRVAGVAAALAIMLSSAFVAAPAQAQGGQGGCTQQAAGGPAGTGNRSGRQNSAAVLPAVIAAAVQNVAVPVTALNPSGTNLNVVCLNDTLNQNDVRVLQDILNESPILSQNSNNLNNLLQGSDIAVANGVQVVAVDLGSGDVFLLRQ
jgi:hypothetical protein